MKNLRQNKGITLIALIITIIVMLVLVGVTINVALNGGLFDKAKNAATETEKQSIYEQIVMGMQLDGSKIDIAKTLEEAEKTLDGYTINPVESGTNYQVITVEGKNGTHIYTITDEGIRMGNEKPVPQNPIPGTYYQLNGTSMTFDEEVVIGPAEWGLGEGATYTYNETDSTITASNGVTLEFHQLGNTKILINEGMDLFFATSRNGLEGHEISGTYVDETTGETLTIDSDAGTWKTRIVTDTSIAESYGEYYYYNQKIYSNGGYIWGCLAENGTDILEYYTDGYNTFKFQSK